jgi:hypothetical protein
LHRSGLWPPYDQPATTRDFDFGPVPVECASNGSLSGPTGSDCNVTTSANSVVPGSVVSGSETIVQVFRVRVIDANNSIFQQEGFFSP